MFPLAKTFSAKPALLCNSYGASILSPEDSSSHPTLRHKRLRCRSPLRSSSELRTRRHTRFIMLNHILPSLVMATHQLPTPPKKIKRHTELSRRHRLTTIPVATHYHMDYPLRTCSRCLFKALSICGFRRLSTSAISQFSHHSFLRFICPEQNMTWPNSAPLSTLKAFLTQSPSSLIELQSQGALFDCSLGKGTGRISS